MLLATFDVPHTRIKNANMPRIVIKCDQCGRIKLIKHLVKAKLACRTHFCSRVCNNTSLGRGTTKAARVLKCLEKFGVDHPHKSPEVRAKYRKTCLERFGVENPSQSLDIKRKKEATSMRNFGVPHPNQNPQMLSKNMRSRRKSCVIVHWKTNEELVCVASYEIAFVNWCNHYMIDFDWQIPHKMPDKHTYIIDAYVKDGKFAGTWIEVKGSLYGRTKQKWEWFHSEHPNNSQLWEKNRLQELGILVKCQPNSDYMPRYSTR